MKPLSAANYYLNNKKRSILLLMAVILSTALLYTVQMLVESSSAVNYRSYVEPQKYFSSIAAKSKVLSPGFVSSILSHSRYYDKAIPFIFNYTNIETPIQGSVGCKVLTVKQEDMKLLMSQMKLKVVEGRLPRPGTDEIILHRLVAAGKGLGIGGRLGSGVRKDEALQGDKTVVGLLDGESIVSFESLEYWMKENNVSQDDFSLGMILLHSRDTAFEIERFLNTLDTAGLEVRTLSSVKQQNGKDTEGVTAILALIGLVVILIVAVCTSFISYINILYRRSELGILNAIGYSSRDIVNRIFRELALINSLGFLSGAALSILGGLLMNLFLFGPKGQYLLLASPGYFMEAACIPLFSTVFGIIPVWRLLKNLDPITVIEGIG